MDGVRRTLRALQRISTEVAVAALLFSTMACSRGPSPPEPREDLTPSIVGVIDQVVSANEVTFVNGGTFAPPPEAEVERLKNWPGSEAAEPPLTSSGNLLLGGVREDGSWWYQLAGYAGPNEEGCWPVYGGSFDRGASIQFSSGLIAPKAGAFEVRANGHSGDWFPGHQDDNVCLNSDGQAVYFQLFIGS